MALAIQLSEKRHMKNPFKINFFEFTYYPVFCSYHSTYTQLDFLCRVHFGTYTQLNYLCRRDDKRTAPWHISLKA